MSAHAVLVCGPGIGHVNGCILFATALLSTPTFSGVTLVCFARAYEENLSSRRLQILSNPSIRLEVVQDGLPAEKASHTQLFAITPTMRENLAGLLQRLREENRPATTCFVSDLIMAWTQSVADAVGIPRVELWTASATSYLCILSIPQLISEGLICCHKGPAPKFGWKTDGKVELDSIPGMPGFALEEVPREFRYAESSTEPLVENFVIAAQNARKAACVLVHSAYDLEPEAFDALRDVGITAYAVGPLLHHEKDQTMDAAVRSWLDSQAPASVMYVSFGSHAKLQESELVQLALGLQASGHPFLLVVREDATVGGPRPLQQLLTPEFLDYASVHSLILPWAPQRALLGHPAVGGFLSHCGWNSTLESLWMGVPILACPRIAEQPLNCRLIVNNWGVGVELPTALDGSFSQQDVSAGIRSILAEDIGRRARSKAQQLSKRLRQAPLEGGHSYTSLREFASTVVG